MADGVFPILIPRWHGGAPDTVPQYAPAAHLFPQYAGMVVECAAAGDYDGEDLYTALSTQAFSALPFRKQLDEFRKLGMVFENEQEFVRLLIPVDANYPSTHTPYTLPCVPEDLSLQQTLRHISHLEEKVIKLQDLLRKLIKETKDLVKRARLPPTAKDVKTEYTKTQLAHILELSKARNAHKTLLEKLLKRKKSLLRTYNKEAPRSFFVPHRSDATEELLPIDPTDTLPTIAAQLLEGWTTALPTRRRQAMHRPVKPVRPAKKSPMTALDNFLQAVQSQPEMPEGTQIVNSDHVGGYKTGFDSTMGTLTTCTMNMNGLTESKLDMVLQLMKKESMSVCILVDTRISAAQSQYFGKRTRAVLGAGTRVHCSKLSKAGRNKRRAVHRIGGIMFIVAPAWGPSLITCQDDYSECGALSSITLQSTRGRIYIMGSYWPIRHTMDETTLADQNLWSRLAGYIHSCGLREAPIDYLQRLIATWSNTAVVAGAQAVILGGDLNATWLQAEPGGQRALDAWASGSGFSNGPRLLAEHRGDMHVTRPRSHDGTKPGTWIDHLLHSGDCHHIDPLASYSSTGAEWAEISDHRPLWIVYRTGQPSTPLPSAARASKPRIELDVSDKRVVEDYAEAMRKYILRRPPDLSSCETAAVSLLAMQNISPIVTEQLNRRYGKNKKRRDMKDGWSPAYMAYKLYLIMVTEVKRRLVGAKGRRRWANWEQAQSGIQWLLLQLKTNTACLDLKPSQLQDLYTEAECGPEWWSGLTRAPTLVECEAIIGVLRTLMHGRQRTDFRTDMNEKVAYKDHMRKLNKMKSVIKSILGVLGARKHMATLNLEAVKDSAGTVACSPEAVHSMITDHFREWYANPPANNSILHTDSDWQASMSSLATFQAAVGHTGVPDWASAVVYDAMTNVPDRDATEAEMAALFASPPSYSDFCRAITRSKKGSAPGMSGLSYNMIKSWPEGCKQAAYDCLSRQWEDKHICPSWKWRWLVPIPKKFNDLTLLDDLRPLMLVETMRKIWTKLIIDNIQRVWRARHTLNPSQHGCQSQLGTSTASILHIDSIEAAQEADKHLHRSSWDKSRAFDSVSKNLMRIAWHRHGVPLDILQYMVNMDLDGPTVVRTPHAAVTWEDDPYVCVDSIHQPQPNHANLVTQLLGSFIADRGTGQGDVTSPAC